MGNGTEQHHMTLKVRPLYLKIREDDSPCAAPIPDQLQTTIRNDPHRLVCVLSCGCGWTDDFSQLCPCTQGCLGCPASRCPACGCEGIHIVTFQHWMDMSKRVGGELYARNALSNLGVISYGGPYKWPIGFGRRTEHVKFGENGEAVHYYEPYTVNAKIDYRPRAMWGERN